ncbi:MAG: hypothetical protein EOP11_08825 [Proteobacteria bacterium]|nr:MAG: hypothetical protein EOP11_08825 [Pseudomonadota bacterium]
MRFFKFFIPILFLAFGAARPAAALPEGVSPAEWDNLTKKIIAEGTASESLAGTYLTLKRIVPEDKTITHQADYLSVVGSYGEGGEFHAGQVEAVFEGWERLPNGNWAIDQWLFPASIGGNLRRCYHVRIVEDNQGSVIEHELKALTEEEASEAWAPRLRAWLEQL